LLGKRRSTNTTSTAACYINGRLIKPVTIQAHAASRNSTPTPRPRSSAGHIQELLLP